MNEQENFALSQMLLQIESLKNNSIQHKDLNNLAIQLQQIRDLTTRLESQVLNIKNEQLNIDPIISKLDDITKEVKKIDKKTPPIATLIAAGTIMISILGVSYMDLQKIRQPIKMAVSKMNDATTEISNSYLSFEKNINKIKEKQDAFVQNQEGIIKKIKSALDKIEKFDISLSRLIADVSLISQHDNLSPINSPIAEDADELDIILKSLGGSIPRYMKLYIDAKKYYESGDYEKGIRTALEAKKIDPDKSDSTYDNIIGRCYQKLGRYKEAIGAYQNGLSRNSDDDSIWNNLGSLYYLMAKEEKDKKEINNLLEKALNAGKKSYELDPTDSVAINTSIILNELEKYDDSLQMLSVEGENQNPSIYKQRGATFALKGDVSSALSEVSKAIQYDPKITLRIALDDDFTKLRTNDGFVRLISKSLGSQRLIEAVKRTWEEDAQQVVSPDSQ